MNADELAESVLQVPCTGLKVEQWRTQGPTFWGQKGVARVRRGQKGHGQDVRSQKGAEPGG